MGILQVKELRMKTKIDFIQTYVDQIKRCANTPGSHWMLLLAAVCKKCNAQVLWCPSDVCTHVELQGLQWRTRRLHTYCRIGPSASVHRFYWENVPL